MAGQVLWNRMLTGEPWARVTAGNPSTAVPATAPAPEMNLRRDCVTCCMACCLLSGLQGPAFCYCGKSCARDRAAARADWY
ncbi:Uncharacterised protein [Bordetella pertussis]|nr:Uncharacterised protein [Bordetella pertussis]CFP62972.1 Uncharacterised protein [Bordetella pertussis]